jgi:murein DD-endopeptidase MepM/ murein hydrolase activator NlpD
MLKRILVALVCCLLPTVGNTNTTSSTQTIDISNWQMPLANLLVTDIFGFRQVHPVTREKSCHSGIDFRARRGTPVYAVTDGWITIKAEYENYGKMLELTHDDNEAVSTRYAHLKSFASGIELGTEVSKGQVIGYSGRSGRVNAAHLHFEIHVNDVPRDPFPIFGRMACKWDVEHALCSGHLAAGKNEQAIVPINEPSPQCL